MSSTKPSINLANKYDRVIVLVDMDCFYCQVEEKLDPTLAGKPIAVVQYNAWRGGGIIAVNYPARTQGVTRHMRGEDAQKQCPDIVLVRVPSVREKADLTKYREAGKEVAAVLQTFTPLLERASVDEAYLDITEQVSSRLKNMAEGTFRIEPKEVSNTYAVGYDKFGQYIEEILSTNEGEIEEELTFEEGDLSAVRNSDLRLLVGASIASEIRAKVKEITGFECSAGIAHNKILAKLACGINKPNKQTILPLKLIRYLFSTLPVSKIKGLGGKFGEELCQTLNIKYIGELLPYSEAELKRKFDEKTGSWLYLIARGIDLEAVVPRFYSKSIGCCKKFPGRNAITGLNTLNHWFLELAKEISDRIEKDIIENNRKAKQMVVSYVQEINGEDISSSRSTNLIDYDPDALAKLAFETFKKNTEQFFKPNSENILNYPLKFLGISVGKFENIRTNNNTLQKMFLNQSKKKENESLIKVNSDLVDVTENPVETTETKPNPKSFFANHFKNKSPSAASQVVEKCDNQPCPTDKTVTQKGFFSSYLKKSPNNITISENKSCESKSPFLKQSMNRSHEDLTENEVSTNDAHISLHQSDDELNVNITAQENISSKPNTSSYNPDFTNNYVEYLVPEVKPEDYIICDKCGKKILSYTQQMHNDFHFALEVSRQQREEFRNEMKSKIVSPPAKKQKVVTNNKIKTNDVVAIDKFLKKISTAAEVNSTLNDNETECKETCSECGAQVVISKMIEHLDYHAAKKLQLELNRQDIQKNSFSQVNSSSRNNKKTNSKASITGYLVSKN